MKIQLEIHKHTYSADLSQPIDISIPLGQVKCFHAPDVIMTPYISGDFIGSVNAGAPVNFYNVQLNPHGNGTHTECLGHITKKQESINQTLKKFHFVSYLLTAEIETLDNEDRVITKEAIQKNFPDAEIDAIIIRTSPNSESKLNIDYSDTNPPYLSSEAMQFLVDQGVQHLCIDTPSVDREVDAGLLAGHHIFWGLDMNENIIDKSRGQSTITEMVYIPEQHPDGWYLLNLQIAPLELDATPSKPVIYPLIKL